MNAEPDGSKSPPRCVTSGECIAPSRLSFLLYSTRKLQSAMAPGTSTAMGSSSLSYKSRRAISVHTELCLHSLNRHPLSTYCGQGDAEELRVQCSERMGQGFLCSEPRGLGGGGGDPQVGALASQQQVGRCRQVSPGESSGRWGQGLGPDGPFMPIKEPGFIPKDSEHPWQGLRERKS